MAPLNCSGIDARTATGPTPAPGFYFATGFIDLQVNGFAGVDYNQSCTAAPEIARSLRAQFAAGVTRLYPTVITGAPYDMAACLRNLAASNRIARGFWDGPMAAQRNGAHWVPFYQDRLVELYSAASLKLSGGL